MTNGHIRPTRATSRMPEFQSRADEAAFWDTHEVTKFQDETRPVKPRVGKQLSQSRTVRLDRQDRVELERRATEQGIGPSTLVRMWIKDRLRHVGG